jgi:hypothetical protein
MCFLLVLFPNPTHIIFQIKKIFEISFRSFEFSHYYSKEDTVRICEISPMSQLVKMKRQANFKDFKRFGSFKGLVEQKKRCIQLVLV